MSDSTTVSPFTRVPLDPICINLLYDLRCEASDKINELSRHQYVVELSVRKKLEQCKESMKFMVKEIEEVLKTPFSPCDFNDVFHRNKFRLECFESMMVNLDKKYNLGLSI